MTDQNQPDISNKELLNAFKDNLEELKKQREDQNTSQKELIGKIGEYFEKAKKLDNKADSIKQELTEHKRSAPEKDRQLSLDLLETLKYFLGFIGTIIAGTAIIFVYFGWDTKKNVEADIKLKAEPIVAKMTEKLTAKYDNQFKILKLTRQAKFLQEDDLKEDKNKTYEEIIKTYKKIIEEDPTNDDAYKEKGRFLIKLNKPKEAIEEFDKAIKLNPKNHNAFYYKANALTDLDLTNTALEAYEHAIQLNPDEHKFYINKSLVLYKKEEFDKALTNSILALAKNPNSATAFIIKGMTLGKLEKHEDSIEAFKSALSLDNNNAIAWYDLAIAYSLSNKREETIDSLRKANKLDNSVKERVRKDTGKGKAFEKLKDDVEFIELFGK